MDSPNNTLNKKYVMCLIMILKEKSFYELFYSEETSSTRFCGWLIISNGEVTKIEIGLLRSFSRKTIEK